MTKANGNKFSQQDSILFKWYANVLKREKDSYTIEPSLFTKKFRKQEKETKKSGTRLTMTRKTTCSFET